MKNLQEGIIQSKYKNKTFDKRLKKSQKFVDILTKICLEFGFIVRKYEDKEPLLLPSGEEIRGFDLLVTKEGKSAFIDGKDFGRFGKYPATGLPISMYDKYIKIKEAFNIDCYLFFRDNKEVEKQVEEQNLKFKDNKKNIYIPYGGEIDSLKEHSISENNNFRCGWPGKYYDELQIIWKVNNMHTIYHILEDWNNDTN